MAMAFHPHNWIAFKDRQPPLGTAIFVGWFSERGGAWQFHGLVPKVTADHIHDYEGAYWAWAPSWLFDGPEITKP